MKQEFLSRGRRALEHLGVDAGRYDSTVRARREQILSESRADVILDVGGNVGQYALGLRRAGWRGPIISFEPMSAAFSALAAASIDDPDWRVERLALSNDEGEIEMLVTGRSVFATSVEPTSVMVQADPAAKPIGKETAPCMRLDKYAAEHHLLNRRLALKIDVQGAEQSVLAGAEKTLKSVQYLELELPLSQVYEGQWTLPESLEYLYDHGFEGCLVENLMRVSGTGRSLQMNMVLVPRGSR